MAAYSTELDDFIAALDTALDSTNEASANFVTNQKYARAFLEKALFEICHAMMDNVLFTRHDVRSAILTNPQRIIDNARESMFDDIIVPNNETAILEFSFPEQTGPATFGSGTVDIEVANGTDPDGLIAIFQLSEGALAEIAATPQVSGTTPNDFTGALVYDVDPQDGGTPEAWTVTVTIAA